MSGPFDGVSVERISTAERVAAAVRDLILRGTLEPGTALREAEICASLGVSRNTLREGMRILGEEGLVTHSAHRGVTVTTLTEGDVRDIFEARRTLELRGAELCYSASTERLEALRSASETRDRAVDEQDWTTAFDADMQFHAVIVSLIGSARLDHFFLGVLRELRLAYYLRDGFETERLERDRHQHGRILSSIETRDVDLARSAVLEHLRDSEALLRELVAAGRVVSPSAPSRVG
jgi:DNA-binding GntR family transcriptional regulator